MSGVVGRGAKGYNPWKYRPVHAPRSAARRHRRNPDLAL